MRYHWLHSIYGMCTKCTHIFKLAVAHVTSSLSFMGNGTLWPFQIYEILLSKGISRSEKKKSRSCRDAFTVSCVSKNVKEKYNDINCESSTFSFSLFKCSHFSFVYTWYTCAESFTIFYLFYRSNMILWNSAIKLSNRNYVLHYYLIHNDRSYLVLYMYK